MGDKPLRKQSQKYTEKGLIYLEYHLPYFEVNQISNITKSYIFNYINMFVD